jgi:hypothetical protein
VRLEEEAQTANDYGPEVQPMTHAQAIAAPFREAMRAVSTGGAYVHFLGEEGTERVYMLTSLRIISTAHRAEDEGQCDEFLRSHPEYSACRRAGKTAPQPAQEARHAFNRILVIHRDDGCSTLPCGGARRGSGGRRAPHLGFVEHE